jgi:hypothetical protein
MQTLHVAIRLLGWLFLLGLWGCTPETIIPTRAALAPTVALPTVSQVGQVPATWTAAPPATFPSATAAGQPAPTLTPSATATFRPTRTPISKFTPTAPPTLTAVVPTNTPISPTPIAAGPITRGPNILPNGSFEDGDNLQGGQPELQVPNGWTLEWDEGRTGFGDEVWDVYVRPEVRVLSTEFLPPSEHALFIWDGEHTVKAFKGYGAISYRLFRDVYLEPGVYELEINLYPDLIMAWNGNQKVWADDPDSGEMRFIAPGAPGWRRVAFGRKNTFTHTFTIGEATNVPLGVAIRGRFAIANNGWFLDDWSLRRVTNN